ncbi:hypothetical protein [Tateyamaria sp. ANG-S1]|uniref:hypothetical protein n=1 Tax=Tateyamaria sp. ANG-S1 TaxID=1577905 RepID=UPI00057CE8CB|nr:hypothetical protein [Tateyamaria sp. ANG-S1]KIC51050.1 hypothetical protein RA29_04000 [Tateyamaria sp. ANG-S1]
MRWAAMLLWIAVPFLAVAAHNTFGSPHLLFSYTFLDNGDAHNPTVARQYTSCTYYGWGWHTVKTADQVGRCPIVRLFHLN